MRAVAADWEYGVDDDPTKYDDETITPFHSPGSCLVCDRGRRDGAEVNPLHEVTR